MRSSYKILAATFALVLLGVGPAVAWDNTDARFMFHVGPKVAKNECVSGNLASCMNAVVKGNLVNDPGGPHYYYTYVIISRFDMNDLPNDMRGLAGAQFGIDYNGTTSLGVDVFSWGFCGALQFPSDFVEGQTEAWPNAHSGILLTWDLASTDPIVGCQEDSVAVCGYLYLGAYSADQLRIISRPIDSAMKVATCTASETILTGMVDLMGYASFSEGAVTAGRNPCLDVVPTKSVTWGHIKGMYR